jgi:hypothetical protein
MPGKWFGIFKLPVFMKQVSFNYKQDLDTLHPDFGLTAEFSVTANVAEDESEDVQITSIEARVYTPFGGSDHWEKLPVPTESGFNRESHFLLALFRSKARDAAYAAMNYKAIERQKESVFQ